MCWTRVGGYHVYSNTPKVSMLRAEISHKFAYCLLCDQCDSLNLPTNMVLVKYLPYYSLNKLSHWLTDWMTAWSIGQYLMLTWSIISSFDWLTISIQSIRSRWFCGQFPCDNHRVIITDPFMQNKCEKQTTQNITE